MNRQNSSGYVELTNLFNQQEKDIQTCKSMVLTSTAIRPAPTLVAGL